MGQSVLIFVSCVLMQDELSRQLHVDDDDDAIRGRRRRHRSQDIMRSERREPDIQHKKQCHHHAGETQFTSDLIPHVSFNLFNFGALLNITLHVTLVDIQLKKQCQHHAGETQ